MTWYDIIGAMKASVALEFCNDMHGNIKLVIYSGTIISDDDTTIQYHLKHKGDIKKLPNHISDPTFFDPILRVKVMTVSF